MNNDIQYVNSKFHKKKKKRKEINKYITEQHNAFAVCHNICFRQTRQVINLLKSSTSNTNNENNNNNSYHYNNANKITIMKCRIKVFFSGFRQFSVYFGHLVYFGHSSNRIFLPPFARRLQMKFN